MRAASPRGRRFQQPPAHSRKRVLEVSSEPWSWRSRRSSHGLWIRLPAEPSQRPPPGPAPPRHPAPPTVSAGRRRGLGYHPRFSKQDACRRSGQRLRMDLQPEALRASSTHLLRLTQFCALLLSLTFLHRLPGASMAYRARAGAGILSAVSEARGPEAGGGGAGRRGLLATGLARAVVGTRSCSRL